MTRWASTATWAERNVTLDGRPFRREEWPQIVDFVEALDVGEGKTIIAMMPPQRPWPITTMACTLSCNTANSSAALVE